MTPQPDIEEGPSQVVSTGTQTTPRPYPHTRLLIYEWIIIILFILALQTFLMRDK